MLMGQKFSRVLFSILVILTMTLSNVGPTQVQRAQAQTGDGLNSQVNAERGRASCIGPESGRMLSAPRALGTFLRPQDPGQALMKRFAPEFGIQDPARELSEIRKSRADDGRLTARYQQNYQGI